MRRKSPRSHALNVRGRSGARSRKVRRSASTAALEAMGGRAPPAASGERTLQNVGHTVLREQSIGRRPHSSPRMSAEDHDGLGHQRCSREAKLTWPNPTQINRIRYHLARRHRGGGCPHTNFGDSPCSGVTGMRPASTALRSGARSLTAAGRPTCTSEHRRLCGRRFHACGRVQLGTHFRPSGSQPIQSSPGCRRDHSGV